MKKATGDEPRMWGSSIVGFGEIYRQVQAGASEPENAVPRHPPK